MAQFVQGFVNRVLADLTTWGYYTTTTPGGVDETQLLSERDGAFHSDSSVRLACPPATDIACQSVVLLSPNLDGPP